VLINRSLPTNSLVSASQPSTRPSSSPNLVATQTAAPTETAEMASLPKRIANVSSQAVADVQKDIGRGEFVEGEVIVKLNPLDTNTFGDFASAYGGKVVEQFDIPTDVYKSFNGDLIRIKLPSGISTAEAIAAMREDDRVAYAESNDILEFADAEKGDGVPDDMGERLWGFRNTGQTGGTPGADANIVEAWKTTTGDGSKQGPLIAVIDSGTDMQHPDLVGNLWTNPGEIPGDGIDNDNNGVIDDVHGYHAADEHGNPVDRLGHGTHVAGTIGAVGNNGEGVTGVMQDSRLMTVRIDSGGRITTDGTLRGILYATKMGADITNNSWGGSRPNKAVEDALRTSPALHFAAAMNNSNDMDKFPKYPMGYDIPNMVAVAASDHNDQRPDFSNYGVKMVDLAAPGKDIWSTQVGGGYEMLSGTSMASPMTAGVAGLIMSAHPDATHEEIKERLFFSSDPKEALQSTSASGGRINAGKAVEVDNVAPGAPNDFGAHDTYSRGTTLRWTSTGDDKWSGNSAATELRVSTGAISAENFQEARALKAPTPGEAGNFEKVVFDHEPSPDPQTYHFAMKVVDNVGNRSELRTTSVTIPGAAVTFEDNFDGEETSWSKEGTWNRVGFEGRGKVWGNAEMPINTSTGITSPVISLKDSKNNMLKLDTKFSVTWFDEVTVQVSNDGGESWNQESMLATKAKYTDWNPHQVDLSKYDGQDILVRVQADTGDIRHSSDEFYLDNLRIVGDHND
jgi:subtilisin family serine protease